MYPSTVVMNVVPAQVAGVESLAVASPPQKENGGLPDARVLAACALLGVDEVYAVGGAQAIAMFAYGSTAPTSGRCEPVDMITGPGNIWVTAAKRLLRGVVGIDAEAGPTEIAILADDTADPVHVAADLISQAEHDPLAASVLVTAVARRWPTRSRRSWPGRSPATKHAERITRRADRRAVRRGPRRRPRAGPAGGRRVRRRAPGDPDPRRARSGRCGSATPARSSSAPWSPVSLGDYCAGSNHVLPTGGCARHSGGLSVQSFLRGVHVIEYDEAALRDVAGARGHAGRGRGPARARPGRSASGEVRAVTDARRAAAPRRPARADAVRRAAARRRRSG